MPSDRKLQQTTTAMSPSPKTITGVTAMMAKNILIFFVVDNGLKPIIEVSD